MTERRADLALYLADLGGGGAEAVSLRLVAGLLDKGYAVDVIVEDPAGVLSAKIDPRARFIPLGSRAPWVVFPFLWRYLGRGAPRRLLVPLERQSTKALFMGLCRGYRGVVPGVHGNLRTRARLEHRTRRFVLRALIRLLYPFAKDIIAISEEAAAACQSYLPACAPRIQIVPNGCDVEALRDTAKETPPHPWFQERSVPVLVACGRLVTEKGFDVLLHALKGLCARRPVRLVVMGEGPLRAWLEALTAELGLEENVAFLGFVPNAAAWFAHADVFVLPSRTEGLSLVLQEALIVRARIVSTDCAVLKRLLGDGRYGVLVRRGDADALEAGIETVLAGDRREDPADIVAGFGLEAMVAGYEKALGLAAPQPLAEEGA